MTHLPLVLAIVIAYLLGSISSAVVVCKLMGLPDPRSQGSKNPGATNVLRIGGKKAAIITLVGDVLKGVIPVLLGIAFGFDSLGLSMIALAAFLGHLFPIFFRFTGGKGVATALGCILALSWPVGLALIGTWLAVAFFFRYSSLAALLTAIFAPFYLWFYTNPHYATMAGVMSLLVIYRHKKNIQNLIQGKETKIGRK